MSFFRLSFIHLSLIGEQTMKCLSFKENYIDHIHREAQNTESPKKENDTESKRKKPPKSNIKVAWRKFCVGNSHTQIYLIHTGDRHSNAMNCSCWPVNPKSTENQPDKKASEKHTIPFTQ